MIQDKGTRTEVYVLTNRISKLEKMVQAKGTKDHQGAAIMECGEYAPKIPRCKRCGKDLGRFEDHMAICLSCTFVGYWKRGEFPYDKS